LQIVADRVELETPKHQKDRFKTLKAQAQAAGWLDRSTRRPLPRPPRLVGLIAGERSQARADVRGKVVLLLPFGWPLQDKAIGLDNLVREQAPSQHSVAEVQTGVADVFERN
jgi:hypothetical protein